MSEAGELVGMSERQFRRYRDRYEEDRPSYTHRNPGDLRATGAPATHSRA
jgi:hypothetical protein